MVNMAISPPMYTAANALATIDAFPADNAAVTFVGTASTSCTRKTWSITRMRSRWLRLTFCSRKVSIWPHAKCITVISMRIVRQYDINNDRMPCRVDVLYGFNTIRAPMACRIWG
jgi:hypothetical protein